MRVLSFCIALLSGAVLGLGAGLVLRHATGSPKRMQPEVLAAQSEASTALADRHTKAAGTDSSPLTTRAAGDLSMSTGVTRWLYWWQAIEKATPADFPRLARLAQGNPVATRLVAERWAELAPKQFFEAMRADPKLSGEFANILFTSWLKKDQAAVIAALNGTDSFAQRIDWRRQVATTLMDSDPETGLRLMSQWHIENYGPNMGAVKSWAAADPRHAAEFTLANPAGFASQLALQAIGEAWSKTAPADAMAFATAPHGDLARTLAQTVLKTWAERNLTEASDWLANADPATLNKYSPAFVEAWAKQDASGALAWCEANLRGSTLTEAVKGLFNGAAQNDVASAAALVSSMQPSAARSQAAVAVAEKWVPDAFGNKTVPPETLGWLASLDPESTRRAVENVSWKWAEDDPSSLAAFLQSATNVVFPSYTYNNLARTLARNDPAGAIDWASRLPEQLGIAAGSSAFSEWGRAQFDAAMQWFNQLPASDARRQPYLSNLLQQLAWDPQASDRFGQAAAVDPATARSVLQGLALSEDRRAALVARLSPH